MDGRAELVAVSIGPLVSALLDTNNAGKTRASAAKTLSNIGRDVVVPLLRTLDLALRPARGPDPFQEYLAIRLARALKNTALVHSLVDIVEGRVASALLDILQNKKNGLDDDNFVRADAAIALGDVGERMAVRPLFEVLKQREHPKLSRAEALPLLRALDQIDKTGAQPFSADYKRDLSILLPILRDISLGVHDSAAHALAEIDQTITVPLAELLQSSRGSDGGPTSWSNQVGQWIINSLGQIGTAHAIWGLSNWPFIPVLVDALHCNDWQAQQSAARALGDIGDISATDPLIELAIQHTYPDVRRVAIEALGTTGNPSSGCLLEFLGQKAKETGDEEGRTAAWALNRINERRKNGER